MKLRLRNVSFTGVSAEGVPTWVDLTFAIEVPQGVGVVGEMAVSVEMTRAQFEQHSISDLATIGEAEIRKRAAI